MWPFGYELNYSFGGSSQHQLRVCVLIEVDPMEKLNRKHHIAVGVALILLVLLLLWGLPLD